MEEKENVFKPLTSMNVKLRLVRSSFSSRVAVVASHDPVKDVLLGCRFTIPLTV